MTQYESAERAPAKEYVIERVIEAPRELVSRAWTDPEHLAQWWQPAGFTVPHCTIDLRVGGQMRLCLSSPEHGELWEAGIFDEIDPPARLVYRDYSAGEQWTQVCSDHAGPGCGREGVVTSVTFEDLGNGKTKLTVR